MPQESTFFKKIRLHRTPRTDRTPYYVVGIPDIAAKALNNFREVFISTWGRDYEDEDPQFWDMSKRDRIIEDTHIGTFISQLASAMTASNHHPAHIYAVKSTHLLIYGCGTCIDHCRRCNFREVPNDWTKRWKQACLDHEKWAKRQKDSLIIKPNQLV